MRFIARDFTAKEQGDLQQSKGGEPVIQNHIAISDRGLDTATGFQRRIAN